MPSMSLRLKPGVDTLATPALNEAGISASQLIRFRGGLVEKRGGWSTFGPKVPAAPRAIATFNDNNNVVTTGIGSTNALTVIRNGVASDISPRVLATTGMTFNTSSGSGIVTITDPSYAPTTDDMVEVDFAIAIGGTVIFPGVYPIIGVGSGQSQITTGAATSTTAGSGTLASYTTAAGSVYVTVVLANHGQSAGGQWSVRAPLSFGGVTLSGNYPVSSVTDANTFVIQMGSAATAAASANDNNGSIGLSYNINTRIGAAKKGNPFPAQDWMICSYGTMLIACSLFGRIFQWNSGGLFSVASTLKNAPYAAGVVVADAQQMIVAFGSPPGSGGDGNYVSWCDAGNPTVWTAAGTNQAGSYRLPTGSGIVSAIVAGIQQLLLWTDVDAWSMSYIGYPLVWGFNKLATGCGLIGRHATAKLGSAVYWMSQNEFWSFDGAAVRPLPCPVRDNVFPQLSTANTWKIRAGANSQFNEVMWFFPSAAGAGENDSYVCYNPVEGTWDYGPMARSAWDDQSIVGPPLGADPTGNVNQHETSPDAAGVAMASSFTTGFFALDETETFSFVDMIRPDVKFPNGSGTLQVTVLACDFGMDAPRSYGPFSFTAATEFINTRCRGRFIALQFASSDLGSSWRMGRVQMRFAPSGKR